MVKTNIISSLVCANIRVATRTVVVGVFAGVHTIRNAYARPTPERDKKAIVNCGWYII